MREEIEKVLNDETLLTNEDRIEALSKGLAKVVIPKERYNSTVSELSNTKNSLDTITSELESLKKSQMSETELLQAEKAQLEADRRSNKIERNSLQVKSLFFDNGIKIDDKDSEMMEIFNNIVSEDSEKTIKLANNFISLFNKTKEQTKNETVTNLINETPEPIVGANKTTSSVDEYSTLLQKAIKEKDVIGITKYTRLYQEALSKRK